MGTDIGAMADGHEDEAAYLGASTPLFDRLRELGLPVETVRHPALFTVEESRGHVSDMPGAHTKNLLLKDKKGRLFLVVAEHATAVDLRTLHGRIGGRGRLSFVDAARMTEVIGVQPGSVTAFAAMNDRENLVTVVLDETLLRHDIVNCHPLINTATTAIAVPDLLIFLRSCGHEPVVARLDDTSENGPDL